MEPQGGQLRSNFAMWLHVIWLAILVSIALSVEVHYSNLDETDCSTTFGVLGNDNCLAAHVRFPHFTHDTFAGPLLTVDANLLVRRMHITFHTHDGQGDIDKIEDSLDSFIMPRPWWLALSAWQAHHDTGENKTAYNILLLRYNASYEGILHAAAMVQYPPADVCASTPLLMSRMLDKGWGSQYTLNVGYFGHPWRIFTIWDSVRNELDETMKYASKGTCPNLVNKRECMFIPITNCTMPAFLTETHGPDTASKCWPSDYMAYTNASAAGQVTNLDSRFGAEPTNSYLLSVQSRFRDSNNYPAFKTSKFFDAMGRQLDEKTTQDGIHSPNVMQTIRSNGLLDRPNARYRKMIMSKVHDFRRENHFPLGTECTSIHIRRGDRLQDKVTNIKEYCQRYRRFSNNGSCIDITTGLKEPWCTHLTDIGCFSLLPFGAATLIDFLSAAKTISSSKVVFIMTDDGAWLRNEIGNLSSTSEYRDWRILALPAHFDRHSPGHDKDALQHETENGVEYFSSVALARQCGGFVGHFGSGLTVSLFLKLCYQHGFNSARCPNAYDVGYAHSPKGNIQWLPPLNIRG